MRKNMRLFIVLGLCGAVFYSVVSVFSTRASDESEINVPNDFFEPVEIEEDKEVLKGFYSEIQISDAASKPVTDPPKINFAGGTVSGLDIISLTCDTTNARFYICVSKEAPLDPSEYDTIVFTKFSSRFRLLNDATLYVFARATGMANSEIAVFSFTVDENAPPAVTTPPPSPTKTTQSATATQPASQSATATQSATVSTPPVLSTTTALSTTVSTTTLSIISTSTTILSTTATASATQASDVPPPPSGQDGPPPTGSGGPPPQPQFYEDGEKIKVISDN